MEFPTPMAYLRFKAVDFKDEFYGNGIVSGPEFLGINHHRPKVSFNCRLKQIANRRRTRLDTRHPRRLHARSPPSDGRPPGRHHRSKVRVDRRDRAMSYPKPMARIAWTTRTKWLQGFREKLCHRDGGHNGIINGINVRYWVPDEDEPAFFIGDLPHSTWKNHHDDFMHEVRRRMDALPEEIVIALKSGLIDSLEV